MLYVTRLTGQSFALNPDLIERAEATPDTVVTLVNGSKYVIAESLDELIDAVRVWRSSLVAAGRAASGHAASGHSASPGLSGQSAPRSRAARQVAAAVAAAGSSEERHESDATIVALHSDPGEF